MINQILDDSSDSESVLSQSVLKEMSQNISPEDLSNVDKIKLDVTSKGTSVKKRKPDELLNEVDRLLHNDEENERSSDEKPPSKKKCTSINS